MSANVPATLSLAVAPGASLGTFAPGVARTYTTSPAASVTSTAGEAALSVADPSPTATGHLVNGTFALPQPLRARVGAGGFGDVGSAAAPLGLHSWSGPVSNDTLAVDFSQAVGANDPLRTGTYSKTLTLSTTSP